MLKTGVSPIPPPISTTGVERVVSAPGGHFFLDTTRSTPVVLIGGGIGLTPVLSMVNHIVETGSKRETWFFYGVQNGEDHAMKEHLQKIDDEHDNIKICVVYSLSLIHI